MTITFTVRTGTFPQGWRDAVRADLYVGDHCIDSAWGDDEAEAIARVEQRLAVALSRLFEEDDR